jgi:hypothetical protein
LIFWFAQCGNTSSEFCHSVIALSLPLLRSIWYTVNGRKRYFLECCLPVGFTAAVHYLASILLHNSNGLIMLVYSVFLYTYRDSYNNCFLKLFRNKTHFFSFIVCMCMCMCVQICLHITSLSSIKFQDYSP